MAWQILMLLNCTSLFAMGAYVIYVAVFTDAFIRRPDGNDDPYSLAIQTAFGFILMGVAVVLAWATGV